MYVKPVHVSIRDLRQVQNKAERFSKEVWNGIRPKYIWDTVLRTKSEKDLTSADLATICESLKLPAYIKMIMYHKEARRGWLSDKLLDAYISACVDDYNCEMNELNFGSVDCISIVHNEQLSIRAPHRRVTLSENPKRLRNELFFPVLRDKHFRLYYLSLLEGKLYLYESVNESSEVEDVKFATALKPFLADFENCPSDLSIHRKSVIVQNDTMSCGVCVCIAVEAICEKLRPPEIDLITTTAFRHWMPYALFNRSVMALPKLLDAMELATSANPTVLRLF